MKCTKNTHKKNNLKKLWKYSKKKPFIFTNQTIEGLRTMVTHIHSSKMNKQKGIWFTQGNQRTIDRQNV